MPISNVPRDCATPESQETPIKFDALDREASAYRWVNRYGADLAILTNSNPPTLQAWDAGRLRWTDDDTLLRQMHQNTSRAFETECLEEFKEIDDDPTVHPDTKEQAKKKIARQLSYLERSMKAPPLVIIREL